MVTGIEVGIAAIAAWLWRRARRAGQAATAEVDEVTDAAVAKLFARIKGKLGADSALGQLEAEASAADPGAEVPSISERTVRRVKDALDEAAEQDAAFATELKALLEALPDPAKQAQIQINAPRDGATVNAPITGNVNNYYGTGRADGA